MLYNPFKRGSHPVGVRTVMLTDENSWGSTIPVEVWYPASEKHRGEDLNEKILDRYIAAAGAPEVKQLAVRGAAPADGKFPLIVQSHAAASHRRDGASACIHLASHGYVVVSPEFLGDTVEDILHDSAANGSGEVKRTAPMDENLSNRERVLTKTLEIFASETESPIAGQFDPARIGAFGGSLGGWTSLRLLSLSLRVKAVLVAVPSWGTRGPFEATKQQCARVNLNDWKRQVPVFLLAGERDALIPLEDMRELYALLPGPKRFGMLKGASHFHWTDGAEDLYNQCKELWENGTLPGADIEALTRNSPPFSELSPNWHGTDVLRVLCLAHFDEHLKGSLEAKAFLDNGLARAFIGRGIDLEVT